VIFLKSKTKYEISNNQIKRMFQRAGIKGVTSITPLDAGEYNAVYSVHAGGNDYVLKLAPKEKIPVLTYEHNIMKAEIFWYRQIAEHTAIKVPEIYFTDFTKEIMDADYFIMEKIDAKPLDEMNFSKEEKDETANQLAKMAAEIHKIKHNKFGYIQGKQYDNWYIAIRNMVSNLISDCKRAGKNSKRGEKLLKYIDANKDILKNAECTMVNFDIHGQNVLCKRENGNIDYYWIDPERSFWGDRIMDFCLFEVMKPLHKKTKTLRAYNSVSDFKIEGNSDERIRCAIGKAYLALLLETEKYYRYTPKHVGWWRNILGSAGLYLIAFKELRNGKRY